MKRTAILFMVMGLLVAMVAGAAFATGIVVKRGDNGNNRLVGTAQNDRLFGMGGNDRLFGQGDSDFLSGGRGHDNLSGGNDGDRMRTGPGNDRINAGEPGRLDGDLINCGTGRDVVFNATPTEDRIRANCEVVRR